MNQTILIQQKKFQKEISQNPKEVLKASKNLKVLKQIAKIVEKMKFLTLMILKALKVQQLIAVLRTVLKLSANRRSREYQQKRKQNNSKS